MWFGELEQTNQWKIGIVDGSKSVAAGPVEIN